MKTVIMLILLSVLCFGKTKYKTFTNHIELINFVAKKYELSADGAGGLSWWSSHKVLTVPYYEMEYNHRTKEMDLVCEWKWVLYWKEIEHETN